MTSWPEIEKLAGSLFFPFCYQALLALAQLMSKKDMPLYMKVEHKAKKNKGMKQMQTGYPQL